jgi:hypothetical protein
MSGKLVGPEIFRRWQAVINNSRVVQRVSDLRLKRNILAMNRVSIEEHEEFIIIEKEMAQMDLLTNFLLDMNHAEPLDSDSVLIDGPLNPDPKETA